MIVDSDFSHSYPFFFTLLFLTVKTVVLNKMNTNNTNLQDNPLSDQENEKLSDENAQIPEIYVRLSFET